MERKVTRIVPRVPLPRRITEIQQKYTQGDKKYVHAHDYFENPLYNASLEKRIEHR
jgi:hypothetical protein